MFLMRREGARGAAIERTARYVDALIASGAQPDDAQVDPRDAEVITQLRSILRPAEPDEQYTQNLRLRLIAAADQRAPEELATWRRPRFLIGAASIVSAAAVIAFVARSRQQTRQAA